MRPRVALQLGFGWLLLAEDLSPAARGELLARGGLLEADRSRRPLRFPLIGESTLSGDQGRNKTPFGEELVPDGKAESDDKPVGFRTKKKNRRGCSFALRLPLNRVKAKESEQNAFFSRTKNTAANP
jgi:hypothetical protein